MKPIGFLLIVVIYLVANAEGGNEREKRGLGIYEFARMITCSTRRSALKYNGYGCWCGLGGRGTPVDATDRCCRAHDMCYRSLVGWNKPCTRVSLRTSSYRRVGCTGCSPRNRGCGKHLCYCDQRAARCFRGASYNSYYENYFNWRC